MRVCAVVFTSGAVALHAVLQFAFQILRLNNLFVLSLAFLVFLTAVKGFSKIACASLSFLTF